MGVTRIALSGEIRGGARITAAEGGSEIVLSVRGGAAGATLYAAGAEGMASAPVTGSTVKVAVKNVCAVALTKGGRIRASGFTGECGRNRARILDEIRIREACREEAAREKHGAPAKTAEPAEAPPQPAPTVKPRAPQAGAQAGRAPVTEDILARAERLFSLLAGEGTQAPAAEKEAPAKNAPREEYERISNPFPRTYPNSTWMRRPGEAGLFGAVTTPRGKKELYAIPIDLPGRRTKTRPGAKTVVGRDGRRYLIAER